MREKDRVAVGIDIGGTKIAGALVAADGTVAAPPITEPTGAAEGPSHVIAVAAGIIGRLVASAGERNVDVQGIGIGTAGVIDGAGTVYSATDHIPGWAGTRLADAFAGFELPVVVLNDVHAFALGEAWVGAAAGHGNVLAVAVGTGIGGAIIQERRLLRGRTGSAGSIGHVPSTYARGMHCACGAEGHVEAIASGPGIEGRYRARTGADLRLPEIREGADRGEPEAAAVISEGAAAMGEALAGAANMLDPDVVVLGGGVMGLGERFLEQVREAVCAGALPGPRSVPVVEAGLGASAVLVGAAGEVLR